MKAIAKPDLTHSKMSLNDVISLNQRVKTTFKIYRVSVHGSRI